jgi:hypothetical protein
MFGGPTKNSEKSLKQVGNHFKALQKFWEVAQDSSLLLCFPLTTVAQYKGYSLICSAAPGCQRSSIISGLEYLQSPDFASPREYYRKFEQQWKTACTKLNLAPATCMDKYVYSGVEVEAFVGSDFRLPIFLIEFFET